MGTIKIDKPEITEAPDGRITWTTSVTGSGSLDEIWYSVDREHQEMLTDRADPAVTALLIPAMRESHALHIVGPVTDELLGRLTEVQAILSILLGYEPIAVRADDARPVSERGHGIATGFSAGIDSFAALADYHYGHVAACDRITHLLMHNVGSHGSPDQRFLFERRSRHVLGLASQIGLPLISVDSNVDGFYMGLGYQQTHTLRSASVAHLLAGGIGRWYYASTYPYRYLKVAPTYDSAYADSILLPWLSTRGLMMESVGSRYRRVDKTRLVAEIPDAWESLDVCVSSTDRTNCSRCWKCLRTMLALDAMGTLPRFNRCFDVAAWSDQKEDYLARVLVNRTDPLIAELRELIAETGYTIPMSTYPRAIKPAVRAALHRLHRH